MKKLVTICAACLIIITAILVYRTWSEHRRVQEAESVLGAIEANRPPRFKTEIPLVGATGSDSTGRLVVSVDDGGTLRLNSEDAGTLDDLSRLRARLEQALRERGGARPDKIVFVKASSKLRYDEVQKVVDAVKGAGADPVGLEVDAPQ